MRALLLRSGSRFALISCAVVTGAVGFSACESCEVSANLYESFQQAYSMPESFDAWLAAHAGYFTQDRVACFDHSILRIQNRQAADERTCDETFTQGSDFWNACYDDADVLYGNVARALFAMRQAARGERRYDQTTFGASAIIFKINNPGLFQARFVSPFQEPLFKAVFEGAMTCQNCSTKLLPW